VAEFFAAASNLDNLRRDEKKKVDKKAFLIDTYYYKQGYIKSVSKKRSFE
jgi:hypothetical protein